MRIPIRRRQLRGLVLHHQRHQAEHPRRLVNRTPSWGEPPVGVVPRPTSSLHVTALTYMRAVLGHHRVNFAD